MVSLYLDLGGVGKGFIAGESYPETLVFRTLKDGAGFSVGFLRGLKQEKENIDLFLFSLVTFLGFSFTVLSIRRDSMIWSVDLYDLLLAGEMLGERKSLGT